MMPIFEKDLYSLITTSSAITALVSNRVYFVLQPKGTSIPSIVLSLVTTNDLYESSGCTGLREGVWQIDCYGADYYTAKSVSKAVRLLLDNYMGNMGGSVSPYVAGTAVTSCMISKDWDMPYEEGGKGFVYRSLLEIRMRYIDS
jgi:hypothetical protein